MNSQHVNPFIQGSQRILQTVCNEEAKLCKIFPKNPAFKFEDVSIHVQLAGGLIGEVVFTMSTSTALMISSKMMGSTITDFSEIPRSAICELTNMITGHVVTDFSSKEIMVKITPPALVVSSESPVPIGQVPTLLGVPLEFSNGLVFEIDIYIE